jgi:hypothetical protein
MESSFCPPYNSNPRKRRNRYIDVQSSEHYEEDKNESRIDWNIVIPCFFISVALFILAYFVFNFVEYDLKVKEKCSINTRLEALQARIDSLETSVANLSIVSPKLFQFDEHASFISEFEKALNLASATNKKSEPTDLPLISLEFLQEMLNLYSPTYWQRFLDFYTSLYGLIATILAVSASFWIVCFLYYGIDATLASIVVPIGKTTRTISNFCNCMHFMIILESAKNNPESASKIRDIIANEDTAIYIYNHIMSYKFILIKEKSPIMMMLNAISDPTTHVEFLMNLRDPKKADLFIKSHRDGDLLEKIVLNLKNNGSMDELIPKDETAVQTDSRSNSSVECVDLKANAGVTVKIE